MNTWNAVPLLAAVLLSACSHATSPEEPVMTDFYSIEARTLQGEPMALGDYKGNVLLIVNTASRCGFTGQYEGLQTLYDTYGDQGLVILGVPSNDFLRQEPGSHDEIQAFCQKNYGVTFPMLEKMVVKGREQHPLYQFLTSKETNPQFSGNVTWNFNKFLVSKEGRVVGRFGSRVAPLDTKITDAIEAELRR